MKFHYASFVHYFTRQFDVSFNVYAHNWILRLIPPNPYFTWKLMQEYTIKALVESLEDPLCPPDGPRQRSLFEAPPVPHIEALELALYRRTNYAEIHQIQTGAGERREYRIFMKVLRAIVIEVRDEQDVALAVKLLPGEVCMSDRLLMEKIKRVHGREFSKGRCQHIMNMLVKMNCCENNGSLRFAGREVLI